ncbi:MBL fold metallo-hydrolase [Vibrio mediterranei]|uniref:MBL fold metallo-hydrolase n=1 Tax=Vibrio mediterranei TaxID=689 RepID=UPI001EFD63D9|nr:MBL fold metallo-hydrolase [Vibrio mediterranei]MCG9659339.1 MBL fold metallo-hydrolase [Vibrio mediterranei]
MPVLLSRSVKALPFTRKAKLQPFTNTELIYNPSFKDTLATLRSYLNVDKLIYSQVPSIPVETIRRESIESDTGDCVFRLGHSAVLMKIDGKVLLTDPVFSDRASPLSWVGPKRFHPLPISLEDLPRIDICLISHDHYDHLDKQTIKQLHERVDQFLVPKRVGHYLLSWGVARNKIQELDWWQSERIGTLTFVFTPTQHFSGRSYKERDLSLWGSWVIQGSESNIYFSGDSGYFSGFRDIGERYGPFDLTLMETGAYDDRWAGIHMFPEQSVQAHIDVKGSVMLPIHNSTFDLSFHAWNEPLKRLVHEASERNVNVVCPKIGEKVLISELSVTENQQAWWE